MPILLASCFAAKEYERPEIVDEQYYRTDSIEHDSISIAEISWKEVFTDSLLQGYIQEGLDNNIDIRIALQQILTAESYVKQGKAGYLPTLNGKATATHQELSSNSQFGSLFSSLDQFELSGSLSWEADIWGKIRSNKRAFQASYLQTVAAHQAVKTELISQIATVYYQLVALDEQRVITKQTLDNRKSSLKTSKSLKDAGLLTEVAVKQTEAQVYTAENILIELEVREKLLENTMSILLGKPSQTIERNELESQLITTPIKTGTPALLLRNRPDVIASEYALIESFELTNVARSQFYPSLTLNASGGFQSLELDKLLSANSLFATFIGGLAQPLLNGRKIKTQYEVSQAQQEQALLRFKQSLLIASKEVSDAMYNYEAATKRIEFTQKEYEAFATARNYAAELLNNGYANYLEVLRAEENTLNSNLSLAKVKQSRLLALVALYRALGGGWQ